MAQYEHLPIFKSAFDLAVHIEKIVHGFSRYHKYTLGTDLRNRSRSVLEKIVKCNNLRDRSDELLSLRHDLEVFKIITRLCYESGGFKSKKAYLHIARQIVETSKQLEGWLRYSKKGQAKRKREATHGQN